MLYARLERTRFNHFINLRHRVLTPEQLMQPQNMDVVIYSDERCRKQDCVHVVPWYFENKPKKGHTQIEIEGTTENMEWLEPGPCFKLSREQTTGTDYRIKIQCVGRPTKSITAKGVLSYEWQAAKEVMGRKKSASVGPDHPKWSLFNTSVPETSRVVQTPAA